MKSTKLIVILIASILSLFSNHVIAENHKIDMLNKLGKERMVYSKKVI